MGSLSRSLDGRDLEIAPTGRLFRSWPGGGWKSEIGTARGPSPADV